MRKKIVTGISKALILSMLLTAVLPGTALGSQMSKNTNGYTEEANRISGETAPPAAEPAQSAQTAPMRDDMPVEEAAAVPVSDKTAEISTLLNTKGPYDLMVKLVYTGEEEGLSRREKADRSQAELLKLLAAGKKEGSVTEYQCFYIVNSAHVITTSAEFVQKIAALPNVERITPNGRIELIEPIKDTDAEAEEQEASGADEAAQDGAKDNADADAGSEAETKAEDEAEMESEAGTESEAETASEDGTQKRAKLRSRSIFVPDEENIEWGVEMVHADKVWEDFGIDGEGVTVGIIDTGVNYRLPALKHAYKGYDEATGTFDPQYYIDCIDGLEEPEAGPVNDHGTHVAGTIAGREGENLNQIGIAPGAKFISARALNDEGGQTDDLMEAAEWMLEQDPDVINNSWGGTNDNDPWFSSIISAWLEEDIIPVFAAGNRISGEPLPDFGSITNPGNELDVLSVGAVDQEKQLADFSKKGPSAFDESGSIIKPELTAPGVQVRSVDAEGRYVSWNGTSMAAPHVTGVVALLREANPSLDVEDIKALLTETAEPLTDQAHPQSPNMAYGYGLVNAYDAVASQKVRSMGTISGTILQKGKDRNAAKAEFLIDDTVYLGRDLTVALQITDDVSVRSAKLLYQGEGSAEQKEIELTLGEGAQNDGIYSALIPADELCAGTVSLRAEIVDYAYRLTECVKEITVQEGVMPGWSEDFEGILQGFLMEGRWNVSERVSSAEPPMADDGKKYAGIDAGQGSFEKRIDSWLYLPPADLSGLSQDAKVFLNADMYNSFTGISTARIEVSNTGEHGDWEPLTQIIQRPDITERHWEHNTYDLSQYAGSGSPVLIRFYFYGHDADEGAGWYLDNLSINTEGGAAPQQVRGLKASVDQKGFQLSFIKLENPDIEHYRIERRTEQTEFEEAALLDRTAETEFIDNGTEPTHYRILWYDETAKPGVTYYYRVQAIDLAGNPGPWSEPLKSVPSAYEPEAAYDFDSSDGGFQSSALSGTVNDWEWGLPERPEGELQMMHKEVWDNLEKNGTKLWGTKLNGSFSQNQDSYLMMPQFTVPDTQELWFYVDSLSTEHPVGGSTFVIEISEAGTDEWYTLVSRERVQNARKQREWQTLSAALTDYAGKEVSIRFHVTTGAGAVFAENMGWYIDNVFVSEERPSFENPERLQTATASEAVRPRTATPSEAVSVERGTGSEKTQAERLYLATASKAERMHPATASEAERGAATAAASSGRSEQAQTAVSRTDRQAAEAAKSFAAEFGEDEERPGEKTIPLRAKLTILETGKYTYSSEIDGSFSLEHSANLPNEPLTLEVSAYGFKTQTIEVDLNAEAERTEDFILRPAAKASLSGVITDDAGMPLPDAAIRIVSTDAPASWNTGTDGSFTAKDIFAGTYRLRVFKEGYLPQEISLILRSGDNQLPPVKLAPLGTLLEETTDYGYVVEAIDGAYQTVHFTSGMKGLAVSFQSPHKSGRLKSADIFLVNNRYYSGSHIQIGVLGYDAQGRLRELAPFREYPGLVPNAWNTIDFSEYNICEDAPIYIAAIYETELGESMGIFYDTKASEEAIKHSYVYDGYFSSVSDVMTPGGYAVKANWLYPPDAEPNPETPDQPGSSGDQPEPIVPDDAKAFIFDQETQTITAYQGDSTTVSIPGSIDGVAVTAIGDHAFDGKDKENEKRIRHVRIPEGVVRIGEEAFAHNNLQRIDFPESLTEIGKGAFRDQWKTGLEDRSLKLELPERVAVISENAFANAGNPLTATLPGAVKLETGSFAQNRKVQIYADALETIEDGAFGSTNNSAFAYALVHTAEDTKLQSEDGAYLINPAVVRINMVNALDKEDVIKIGLKYGPKNPSGQTRDYPADAFYQAGETVTVAPPSFREEGKLHVSGDAPAKLQLSANETDNTLTFYYYLLEPALRLPLLSGDEVLPGFALPGAEIKLSGADVDASAAANEDGYFVLSFLAQPAGTRLQLHVNGMEAGSVIVEDTPSGAFITEGNVLKRYTGSDLHVTIPNAAGGAQSITEIGPFAFYGKSLKTVTLPDKVQTIGAGAFMETGLEKFGWALSDIDRAGLRVIDAYAFRNNALTEIALPELTHAIRTRAFENNEISSLKLSKYIGHVGAGAFRGNRLKEAEFSGTIEEIGVAAFENNLLEKITFLPRIEGSEEHSEGLVELPARSFAGNHLTELALPETVKIVDETAFAENGSARVVLRTDNEAITATVGYDVLRSDGTRLSLENHPQQPGGGESEKPEKPEENKKPGKPGETEKPGSSGGNGSAGSGGSGGSNGSGAGSSYAGTHAGADAVSFLPAGYQGAVKQLHGKLVPASVADNLWVRNAADGRWQLWSSTSNEAQSAAPAVRRETDTVYRDCWQEVYLPQPFKNGLPYGWFRFDAHGFMLTGWYTDQHGARYYLNPEKGAHEGLMLTGWQKIGEKWYYFQTQYGTQMGQLLRNTKTPDGYTVTNDGSWDEKIK